MVNNICMHVVELHEVQQQHKGRQISSFSLCIVQHPVTKKFLLINEFGCEGWWLPAGRLEPKETFREAAVREALEESGVDIRLDAVLRIEHTHRHRHAVLFLCSPLNPDQVPKRKPDYESQEARWFTVEEIERLEMRSKHELPIIRDVASGRASLYPLDLLRES
jgi:phosphatase NudJ